MIQVVINAQSDDVRLDNQQMLAATNAGERDDDTVDEDVSESSRKRRMTNPRNRRHFEFYVSPGTRVGGWDQMFRR